VIEPLRGARSSPSDGEWRRRRPAHLAQRQKNPAARGADGEYAAGLCVPGTRRITNHKWMISSFVVGSPLVWI